MITNQKKFGKVLPYIIKSHELRRYKAMKKSSITTSLTLFFLIILTMI